jgi:hypothetical protein
MTTNLQIISDLRLMMENQQPIEMLNTYKGAPFVCKGYLAGVYGDHAQVRTDGAEIVLLQRDRHTKVLGSDFFEPFSAQVLSVDLLQGSAVLYNFSYLGVKLGERMLARVEPKAPLPVNILIGKDQTAAELADISMSGAGLRVLPDQYTPALKPGAMIHIATELPTGAVSARGTILSAVRAPGQYRFSLRFAPEPHFRGVLFRYLVNRRREIEAELIEEFHRARNAVA